MKSNVRAKKPKSNLKRLMATGQGVIKPPALVVSPFSTISKIKWYISRPY